VLLISDARGIPEGERARLFQAILDAAEPYLLRVLGPASQGFSVPLSNLNVSLNRQPLLPGQIAFVSESGTIGQTALDIGNHYSFGFSHLIHLGESLDIDLADILDYLAGRLPDPGDPAVPGKHRRCPQVHVGGAARGSRQTGHRAETAPLSRGAGRCGVRRRLSPRRSAARG
jgi:hypothetical protein